MGQDFVARKAAKKQRKRSARDAETGRKQKRKRKEDGFEVAGDDDGLGMTAEQVKRRRKKGNNVSLRISRAACYKPPELTAEDLEWDGTENGDDGARNAFSMDGLAEAGYDSDVEEAAQKHIKQQQKQPKQQQQASLKLSTAVNLLNPATAAKLAGMQQQQQATQVQQRPKQSHQQLDDIISSSPLLKALNDSGLNPVVARCMAKLGFSEPTPIQSACWGVACSGRDLLGHAEPGSGKTLAYLLPAFAHLLASSSSSSSNAEQQPGKEQLVQPRVLVLLPSRELAQQVHAQCTALFSVTGISAAVVYGGVPKEAQVELLHRRRPQLLVATPGRLLDLVDSAVLNFDLTDCVVLDEADKMLSVGFEPQLQRLQALLLGNKAGPAAAAVAAASKGDKKKGKAAKRQQEQAAGSAGQQCQVLLFSATLPKAVRVTADAWLKAGYESVSCSAGADSISRSITQVVHVCAEHKKPTKLLKHMAAIKASSEGLRNPPRVLVFANRIKTVLFVHRTLSEAGYRAVLLHGKRSQAERDAAVADFKAGKAQVLVASDVASRGLDIRGLPYVVNYDFPSNLEVYIHRVGRTGRLAAAGHAFSFFTRPLAKLAAPLVSLLQTHEQPVDPNLVQLAEAWETAEAAIKAQGGSMAGLEAAAAAEGAGDEEEEGMAEAEATGAAAVPEDLQEGLSEQQKGALLAAGAAQQQQQPSKRSKKHAGDTLMVPQAPGAAATAGGVADGAAAAAPVAFMPAAAFAGAKPGYAFKKGARGVGYYLDPVQQRSAQQQDKQQRKQEHQKVLQQAMKQYKQQQQGQQGQQGQQPSKGKKAKVADVAAAAAAAAAGKAGGSSAAAPKQELPPLPGLAKKRTLPAFMTSGGLSDDDDYGDRVMDGGSDGGSDSSDDGDQGSARQGGRGSMQQRLQRQQLAAGGGSKRRKALPGRLRKKLAKAAAGGKGAGDGRGSGTGGKGGKGSKGRKQP